MEKTMKLRFLRLGLAAAMGLALGTTVMGTAGAQSLSTGGGDTSESATITAGTSAGTTASAVPEPGTSTVIGFAFVPLAVIALVASMRKTRVSPTPKD